MTDDADHDSPDHGGCGGPCGPGTGGGLLDLLLAVLVMFTPMS